MTVDRVAEAVAEREKAERELTAAVDAARVAGVTWDELADVLGLNSRQAAQKWRARRPERL